MPGPPGAHQAPAAVDLAARTRRRERIAELADAYRADYRAYFEEFAGEGDVPGDPDARIVLVEGMGLVAAGTTTKASKISRDLYQRAIEVMAGAEALGEFVSLDAAGVVRDRVLAAGALQARAGAGARRAAGQGRAGHRRRGRHRARDHRDAGRAPARAWSRSTSTPTARPRRSSELRRPRPGRGRRRHLRGRRSRTRSPPRSRPSAASTSSSPTPASRPARRSRRRRWPSGTATTRSSAPATSSSPARPSACSSARTPGGSIVFIASKNALVAGKNAAAYSSAKAAELHLARCLAEEGGARRHPGQHRQPGRRPAGLEDLGLVLARGARGGLQPRPRASSTSTTASATR